MAQLFMFFVKGELVSVAEGTCNGESEEKYLLSRHNDVQIVSAIGNSYDHCWDIIRFKYFWDQVVGVRVLS